MNLLQQEFPDKLKGAKVMALHKKGGSDNLSNYIPIPFMSIFRKIFENVCTKNYINFYKSMKFSTLHSLVFVRITQRLILQSV